jgi:iron complex outermembrane recepter protein
MKPVVRAAPVAAALGALSVVAISSAAAQGAAPEADGLEAVVVTATRGRAASILETTVPVDVVDASQIATAGAFGGEFAQALQVLVPSFNLSRQSNSGAADLVRPAQLRGLSPDQVLVLVNGKRRHTTSVTGIDAKIGRGTAAVDFNSIPTNAIKRIEVLRDGAGAQYGSDAIAGVVNVILDDRAEGIDLAVGFGQHYTDFDPIDDTLDDGQTTTVQASFGTRLGSDGFLRAGIDFRDRDGTNRAGLDQVPFFEDGANVALVGGQRNFKPGDSATEDVNLWVNAETAAGALRAYGFATYNNRDAEGTGFFRYPVSSANILSVNPLGYRPITLGENEDIALTAGLRGEVGAWSWDGSVSYGRNSFEQGVRNSLNPSLGPTSPRSFRSGETENELASLNLDFRRDSIWALARASRPASSGVGSSSRARPASWRRIRRGHSRARRTSSRSVRRPAAACGPRRSAISIARCCPRMANCRWRSPTRCSSTWPRGSRTTTTSVVRWRARSPVVGSSRRAMRCAPPCRTACARHRWCNWGSAHRRRRSVRAAS